MMDTKVVTHIVLFNHAIFLDVDENLVEVFFTTPFLLFHFVVKDMHHFGCS